MLRRFHLPARNVHAISTAAEIRVIAYSASYKAAYSLLVSTSGVMFLSALYLMKSACGIDLMAGPSPFHALFF